MATAAQLAARRRIVVAATKRHPPRPMPPAQLPRPTAYTRALTSIADELNQEIHAALADEGLPAPRADAADGDARLPAFNREGLLARLKRIAAAVVKRRGGFLDTAIQACAANVSSVSRAEWSRQAKAAVGIDLSQVEPNLTPTINAFRRANLDLITSMARDKVERVKAILEDAPNARVETIRDRILEEGNVTKRQAALIARDQVLSLNAQVTEKRHAAAGVEKYTWRTSGDGDVRPAHRALNGKVFTYADPPVVDAKKGRRENPGQDYQCRCTAEPVIEWGEEEAAAKRTDAGDWKESDHPRDHGKFVEKGGAGGGPLHAKPKSQGSGPPQGQSTTPAKAQPTAKAGSPTKPPPHVTKAEKDAESYAGTLQGADRKAFEGAVSDLYEKSGRSQEDVARLVSGAVRAKKRGVDPTEYLRDAHAIVSRPGVSPETVRCIGSNATGQNPWDLGFINRTALTDGEIDFLAGDRETPWPKWKRAADLAADLKKNPRPPATLAEAKSREGIMRQANLSIRGASAEFVTGQQIGTLVSGHRVSGRQIPLDGKVLDYEITTPPPPRKRYMEVKGVAHDTWNKWLDCHQRRRRGEALTAAEAKAAAKIDVTVAQMREAAAATHPGERPVLALTTAMENTPALAALRARLAKGGVDAEIVFVTENDIVETGRGLRARLGFGKP